MASPETPGETKTTSYQINETEKKKTCITLLKDFTQNITVEPVAFLNIFAGVLPIMAVQTMGLQKTCRVNLGFGDEVCDALRAQDQSGNFTEYERMVQEFYSSQLSWRSALQTVLPCMVLIFVGGWSDMTGRRKAIMLACISGETLHTLNNIINVIYFDEIRLEIYIFFEVFFVGIVGGTTVMFMALFNYICDITTEKNRTYRMGFMSLSTFGGIPLGLSLSGVILNNFGYYAIFGISLALQVINFNYVIFLVFDRARTEEKKKHDGQGLLYFLKLFFNLSTIKETFDIVLKKTKNNRRLQLIIFLGTITFLQGPVHGEGAILYMATRYRFNWDEVDYSIFQTYNFGISMIGTMIMLVVFSKLLQWHDSVLGIIASISKIQASFVFCFATTTLVFYLAPLADILSGAMLSLLAVRTMYSKLLEPCEIGKMTSLIGLIENLTPLIYVPIYTNIYTATMDVLPGAVFLFGAIVTIPPLLAFIVILYMHKKEVRTEKTTIELPVS